MIIWNGLRFLVAVIGIGSLFLAELISERITGDEEFYQRNGWVILVGMIAAAILTYGLHLLLQRRKQQVAIDKETGQEFALAPSDSLFFVPVRWWPAVFVVIGLVFAVVNPGASDNAGQPAGDPVAQE
jgi:ABC-type Fe3+ transport system permease subunit